MYKAQVYLIIKDYKARKNKRIYKIILYNYLSYLVKYIIFNIYKIWVLILNKVIIIRNITFNKNILYLVTRK